MRKALKLAANGADVVGLMQAIGRQARAAVRVVAHSPAEQRNAALHAMAKALRGHVGAILDANRRDMAEALHAGKSEADRDRLALDAARLEAIAASIEGVAGLPDPVGRVLASWQRPNGQAPSA